jgi:hypothetical protein
MDLNRSAGRVMLLLPVPNGLVRSVIQVADQ